MSITTIRSEGQPFQEDASFYVWGDGHTFVAEVTNGDRPFMFIVTEKCVSTFGKAKRLVCVATTQK